VTRKIAVKDSSGNVFEDLRLSNAADEGTKMDLAVAINDIIEARKLRQVEAASVIHATQPQVSALANYKLSDFSIGRLVDFLAALGHDVEIGHRATKDGSPGHVHVRELEYA
jgi:predicted XRE-type DNA-binding protein